MRYFVLAALLAVPWVSSADLIGTSKPWDEWGSCETSVEGLPTECTFEYYPICNEPRDGAGCGPALSKFDAAIDQYIEDEVWGGGECRSKCPSWTLKLEGNININPNRPWVSTADKMRIDGHSAQFHVWVNPKTKNWLNGQTIDRGQQVVKLPKDVAAKFWPADIVLGNGDYQIPIRNVWKEEPRPDGSYGVDFAWEWRDDPVQNPKTVHARVIRLVGEMTTFADVTHIHARRPLSWRHQTCENDICVRNREIPMTVVEAPAWDQEIGFVTESFTHPGDYMLATTNKETPGGANGNRIIATGSSGMQNQHAAYLATGGQVHGATLLLMGNTVDMRGIRRQMGFSFRHAIVVGGHKVEIRGNNEGSAQLVWCPRGCASLAIDGIMNHQNNAALPRDYPWIAIENIPGHPNYSHITIDSPFWFYQGWAGIDKRELLVKAKGAPIYLQIRGTVRHVDPELFANGGLFDVPEGSVVDTDHFYLDGSIQSGAKP